MKFVYLLTRFLEQGVHRNWKEVTDAEMRVMELWDEFRYKEVYLKIHVEGDAENPFFIGVHQLAVTDLKKTLKQVFEKDYSVNPFTPEEHIPIGQIGYVEFINARQQEYLTIVDSAGVFTPKNPFKEPTDTPDITTPLTDLPDLLLARPRYVTDMRRLHTHALVAVNGYLHTTAMPPDDDVETLFVKDGGKTAQISGVRPDGAAIAFLNFDKIGPITKYPLSELTLQPSLTTGYKGLVEIKDIPESLTGKTILLSLGGYLLHTQTGVIEIDGNNVMLDMGDLDVAYRILEASRFLDLSSLEIEEALDGITEPTVNDILTDDVLEAFLKLPQSFLVVVPKPFKIAYNTPVRRFNDDRKLFTEYRPLDLLRSPTGRILTYWTYHEQVDTSKHYMVRLREFENEVDVCISPTYKLLKEKFPERFSVKQAISNEFTSLGFYSKS